ncbi:folate-sensitive fragile site protein Fra10Ac1-domain-containing protein [Mycena pura]|uniref:Folate-sensitive fragile site protein Fra10Ac1-domain-containing protein n=1 Tax=Mycena pura TaxID=153505 RepID=A0AAD6UWR6_9AGAR|nr:folate-sensitive fragile site protein Fra10Ac1-domain-containing protein [Mycena pura]
MALYPYPSDSKAPIALGKTEFEILEASHKFLREEDEDKGQPASWNDQLAAKYYDSLFREFAVCDLKHYKSGNFSLRWRTEAEVLSGAGETTCGNTRCRHHGRAGGRRVALTTLELPFAYTEHGEAKSALVKVVLCEKCTGKLMWKRRKEKERLRAEDEAAARNGAVKQEEGARVPGDDDAQEKRSRRKEGGREESGPRRGSEGVHRRRSSRSRSPRRRDERAAHATRK